MPGNIEKILVAVIPMMLTVACGGDKPAGETAADPAAASAQTTSESSSPDKKASRDCPAKTTSGARPDGAPVDDIVGIRNGMNYDDVMAILECRDDITSIETAEKWTLKQTYDFPIRQLIRASNGTECTGQEIAREMGSYSQKKCDGGGYLFKAKKDITHQISVVFMGMPGEEQVGAVWRRNVFAEGSNPTREALLTSLTEKYGEAHYQQPNNGSIMWVYDPFLKRPMSQASQEFRSCSSYLNPSFAGSHSWRSSCGVTIALALTPVYGNELLVSEMNIGIMDQKTLYEQGEAFDKALLAAYEQRKLEEAANAASNAATPDL